MRKPFFFVIAALLLAATPALAHGPATPGVNQQIVSGVAVNSTATSYTAPQPRIAASPGAASTRPTGALTAAATGSGSNFKGPGYLGSAAGPRTGSASQGSTNAYTTGDGASAVAVVFGGGF